MRWQRKITSKCRGSKPQSLSCIHLPGPPGGGPALVPRVWEQLALHPAQGRRKESLSSTSGLHPFSVDSPEASFKCSQLQDIQTYRPIIFNG
jgi:hypothetical protein